VIKWMQTIRWKSVAGKEEPEQFNYPRSCSSNQLIRYILGEWTREAESAWFVCWFGKRLVFAWSLLSNPLQPLLHFESYYPGLYLLFFSFSSLFKMSFSFGMFRPSPCLLIFPSVFLLPTVWISKHSAIGQPHPVSQGIRDLFVLSIFLILSFLTISSGSTSRFTMFL
jgi:hypothetical protein